MAKLIAEKSTSRLNLQNEQDLNPVLVDRKFGRPEDFVEVFILDLKDTVLVSIPNYKDFTVGQSEQGLTSELNIDPLTILNENGFNSGTFKIQVNIQKRKIFLDNDFPFRIKEVSSTRTEIQLRTTKSNEELDSNSSGFINEIKNSTYFRDFTLNFGNNINITAVNVDIDKSNNQEFLLNVKLLEPLPDNIRKGNSLFIVEDIVEPVQMTYNLGNLPIRSISTNNIKGPNFKIDTRLNSKVPTAFKSFNDLLSTSTTSSYQKLISKLQSSEIPEIDYSYVRPLDTASADFTRVTPSHFENFVHFGSATELLKNFEYKLKLIELYDTQLADLYAMPLDTLQTTTTSEASASILLKKENLIEGFSGYEHFLYFESGTYSWPKSNNTEPYILSSTVSTEAQTWLGSNDSNNPYYGGQLLSASIFDAQNPNRLFKLTPTFIGDKEINKPFQTFCDMVGQHFDPIWTHIKEYTQIRDNSHALGVSKNLVYYALKTLGIDAFDQFENEDLVNYIFGQKLVPNDTSTVITGSNEILSKEDISKEIWKRLYHNAPYLLKTKGTERGLRALINCYGVSDTILDIKEFGGTIPNREEFKLYTYRKFTQILNGNSLEGDKQGFFIETKWSSSFTIDLLNAFTGSSDLNSVPKTVEFRIKPNRVFEKNNDDNNTLQHLFSLTHHAVGRPSGSDLHLMITPYTSSDDVFATDDKLEYAKLSLYQYTSSIAETNHFNLYNDNFWDIHLSTDGISGSNSNITFGAYQANHLREVLAYTASVSITEQANAESFGNPYVNGSHGVPITFIGGIKDINNGGQITSSVYIGADAETGSLFDTGYNGALSEVRYYFGEKLSHKTLKSHALEPLLYGGNSISSSYDHLILRYPLSFELNLIEASGTTIPSQSYAWNSLSSPIQNDGTQLTGPITGGAILSASTDATLTTPATVTFLPEVTSASYSGQPFSSSQHPWVTPPSESSAIFEVGGTPLLQSHHPNVDVPYLDGFTYFKEEDVILITEDHHLPTPNTIGKSPSNRKIRIDSGSTDDNILSPTILSQLPTNERQAPDFSNIGVYLSPQNELNEDIIYTLGTFSLDEFLGDPREQTSGSYSSFKPLFNQYFKKLKRGSDRYNVWDFIRWTQFLDHTLFDLIKKFTPQKTIDKTGILIEPHFLERPKFKRYHPVFNRPEYNGVIQDITASFSKNNNRSQLDNTTGSAVISQYNFIGTGSNGKELQDGINPFIDIAKSLSGSNVWEQGPIIPNSTGSGVKQRNSSGSNELRNNVLTPFGNYLNSKVSKIRKTPLNQNKNLPIINSIAGHTFTLGTGIAISGNTIVFTNVAQNQKANVHLGNYPIIIGRKYKLTYTISGYSGAGDIKPQLINKGKRKDFTTRIGDGTFIETVTFDGVDTTANEGNRFYFESSDGSNNFTGTISNILLEELNPLRDIEFDDELLDTTVYKRSRYDGSRLTGAKINEYTEGDITYGLNPVAEQKSTCIYFGKTLIGADGTEDTNLTKIKNHSYISIEEIYIIDKNNDNITSIDLKNEKFDGINGYVAKDFKNGSSFKIEILDDKINHKLKDNYKAKFNQGYFYKILEHKGINETGNISGEGIQVGYIDSSSADFAAINTTGITQNYLSYAKHTNTITNAYNLFENKLTKDIFKNDLTFGHVDFVSGSQSHVTASIQNYSSFINSMLIPIASESQFRLFGTFNSGQPLEVANYSDPTDAGIRSISTVEFDLEKYNVSSSGLHTLISSSGDMLGFGRELLQPHSFVIPIMQGPHDVITTEKANSGITWPGNGGDTSGHAASSNGMVNFQMYFSGASNLNALYQISYLEESNTIIADIDKPLDLENDIGDLGFVLIPDNLDKDIKNNISFYLKKIGLKIKGSDKKQPLQGN